MRINGDRLAVACFSFGLFGFCLAIWYALVSGGWLWWVFIPIWTLDAVICCLILALLLTTESPR